MIMRKITIVAPHPYLKLSLKQTLWNCDAIPYWTEFCNDELCPNKTAHVYDKYTHRAIPVKFLMGGGGEGKS